MFTQAEWYDRSVNWSARLKREIPVLVDVLGPPGSGGILDAGCGTAHQARALAERGYHVVGADASEEMLAIARRTCGPTHGAVRLILTPYATLSEKTPGGFDGLYCQGNSLAAAGTGAAAEEAVVQFAGCLRTGGRLFIQIINFPLMRSEVPCVRGPRVATVDGIEYVSLRHFAFATDSVTVTNVTLWHDSGWRCRTHSGTLYPITLDELCTWCEASGLRVDEVWGGYDRHTFDAERSADLIIVATRL
jgi:SAM-dependent methyltransferase